MVLLKNTEEGDRVEVDDVIAQIETDKVYLFLGFIAKACLNILLTLTYCYL